MLSPFSMASRPYALPRNIVFSQMFWSELHSKGDWNSTLSIERLRACCTVFWQCAWHYCASFSHFTQVQSRECFELSRIEKSILCSYWECYTKSNRHTHKHEDGPRTKLQIPAFLCPDDSLALPLMALPSSHECNEANDAIIDGIVIPFSRGEEEVEENRIEAR